MRDDGDPLGAPAGDRADVRPRPGDPREEGGPGLPPGWVMVWSEELVLHTRIWMPVQRAQVPFA
jgi:hypothetical protein